MRRYVVPAVSGFFRSISLGRERALQDILRLLTLWFKYGAVPAVNVTYRYLPLPTVTYRYLPSPQVRRRARRQ